MSKKNCYRLIVAIVFVPLLVAVFLPIKAKAAGRETRSVWISRFEWSTEADIKTKIDAAYAANLNTIIFQVRGNADAYYKSNVEPWAKRLTGTLGQDPGWDPLGYALSYAHSKGMNLDAWINTYIGWSGPEEIPPESTPVHIVRAHPEWVMVDKTGKRMTIDNNGSMWLSPGIPGVQTHITNVVVDLVKNYNIDGIHFDFVRYPGSNFSYDSIALSRFNSSEGNPNHISFANWQRDQITRLVRKAYRAINKVKPKVVVSAAVWGYYRDYWNWGYDSSSGYRRLYQDSRRWMRDKIIDIIYPMIYWNIADPPKFDVLVNDFVTNSFDRAVYPGIALYRVTYSGWSLDEIKNQMDIVRSSGTGGFAFFSVSDVVHYKTWLKNNLFPTKVAPSVLPWKDDLSPPAKVKSLSATPTSAKKARISFISPGADGNRGQAASYDLRYYTRPIDVDNWDFAKRITIADLPQISGKAEVFDVSDLKAGTFYYFALRTQDSAGSVSVISNNAKVKTLTTIFSDPMDETATEGVDQLWKTYPFETGGGLTSISIGGSADLGDNMRFVIDSIPYSDDSPYAFDGDMLLGQNKIVTITRNLSAGSHNFYIYATGTPTITSVRIDGHVLGNILLESAPHFKTPNVNKTRVWTTLFSGKGKINIAITAALSDHGNGDDDDLKVVVDGKNLGWKFDGNTLKRKTTTVSLSMQLSSKIHSLSLLGDVSPLIQRIVVRGQVFTPNMPFDRISENTLIGSEYNWKTYTFTLSESIAVKIAVNARSYQGGKMKILLDDGSELYDDGWYWNNNGFKSRVLVKKLPPGTYTVTLNASSEVYLEDIVVNW